MDEIRVYNTIDSTNVEAQRLLTNPSVIAHGTTLVALHQAAGKGQFGRDWHAEAGQHLAMSVILKPEGATAGELPRFSKLISLAIAMALEAVDSELHPQIKWPNDIYLDGKKAGGILIENSLAGNRLQHIIAGLGLNVNEIAFPPELPNAVSLCMITGRSFDVLSLAESIRDQMIHFNREPIPDLEAQYRKRLFKINERVAFVHRGNIIHGVVQDVDDQGRMVLHLDDQLQFFYTHELRWIV